mmetsp:Transcript_36039/g.95695  ORF Transcript_36039/g.95695 Transcript_36039/m.95695 type:complete len:203 (+) Transcript_36039:1144-1752(+)
MFHLLSVLLLRLLSSALLSLLSCLCLDAPRFRELLVLRVKELRQVSLRQRRGFLHLSAPGDEQIGHHLLIRVLIKVRFQLHFDVRDRDGLAGSEYRLADTRVSKRDHGAAHGTVLPHGGIVTDLLNGLSTRVIGSIRTIGTVSLRTASVVLVCPRHLGHLGHLICAVSLVALNLVALNLVTVVDGCTICAFSVATILALLPL